MVDQRSVSFARLIIHIAIAGTSLDCLEPARKPPINDAAGHRTNQRPDIFRAQQALAAQARQASFQSIVISQGRHHPLRKWIAGVGLPSLLLEELRHFLFRIRVKQAVDFCNNFRLGFAQSPSRFGEGQLKFLHGSAP